jgi:hypothetical protein
MGSNAWPLEHSHSMNAEESYPFLDSRVTDDGSVFNVLFVMRGSSPGAPSPGKRNHVKTVQAHGTDQPLVTALANVCRIWPIFST